VDEQGGLHLRSPLGRFGTDGAYLVLRRRNGVMNARRVPIAEHFHLYVDDEENVRTDHSLKLWNIPAVRLHYRLTRMPAELQLRWGTLPAARILHNGQTRNPRRRTDRADPARAPPSAGFCVMTSGM
jgi:hypothetical protein